MSDGDLAALYHLKSNPFASRVQPDSPIAGRKREQETWHKIVSDKIGSHASSLNFVIGDYGLGKTHALYHIKSDAEQLDGVAAVFLKMLPEDEVKNFGLDFIRRIFKNLDQKAVLDKLAKAKPLPPADPFHEHSKIIKEYATGVAFFRDLLVGGTISKAELAKRGIRRIPVSTETALEYLSVLLAQLHAVGVLTLVLCVDEAEYIFSQLSAKKAALVFNSLRAMYDLTSTPNYGLRFDKQIANLIFFFAMSADGWSKLNRMEKVESHQGGPIQPLMSRVNKQIMLSSLHKDESKQLIEEYLRTSRTTGRKQGDPLIPYEQSFVDYLFDLTKGHPRNIVERCDYVITEGLRDHVKLITKAYARQVFERMNLSA